MIEILGSRGVFNPSFSYLTRVKVLFTIKQVQPSQGEWFNGKTAAFKVADLGCSVVKTAGK